MDDFAFELEILEMDGNVEFSFGVQDRSCDVDVHIGNGIDSSLVKNLLLDSTIRQFLIASVYTI